MNNLATLLVSGTGYSPKHWDAIEAAGFRVIDVSSLDAAAYRAAITTADAYLLGGDERLTREVLATAERLRVVSFVGTGVGMFVDEETATTQGITILNTPGVMAPAVAEHTVGLVLGLVRGLFAQNEFAKRGGEPIGVSTELSDCTVGIVGLGAVGTAVAHVLRRGFGCRVIYFSRSRKRDVETELAVEYVSLSDLAEQSDVAVLLLPTSPATEGIWDNSMLSAAKPGQLLVNVGGPRLVDPVAIRAALLSGRLQAAAFDGYWIEPLPAASADPYGLLSMHDRRFIVTPHMAAKTHRTWERMLDRAVENLVGFARRQ